MRKTPSGCTGRDGWPRHLTHASAGQTDEHPHRTGVGKRKTLTHTTSAGKAALSGPDDLVHLGGHVFVAFQNGVGSKGEASPTGNTASTIVEFSTSGKVINQWDVTGKVDGMGAAPTLNAVLASVKEDGNSSLYELRAGTVTHDRYSPAKLPSGGGTDAITTVGKLVLISASAPSTTNGLAVYKLTSLRSGGVARLAPLFADDAKATVLNPGELKCRKRRLALTDPDSSALVPASVSGFGGDFVLNSQGDKRQGHDPDDRFERGRDRRDHRKTQPRHRLHGDDPVQRQLGAGHRHRAQLFRDDQPEERRGHGQGGPRGCVPAQGHGVPAVAGSREVDASSSPSDASRPGRGGVVAHAGFQNKKRFAVVDSDRLMALCRLFDN